MAPPIPAWAWRRQVVPYSDWPKSVTAQAGSTDEEGDAAVTLLETKRVTGDVERDARSLAADLAARREAHLSADAAHTAAVLDRLNELLRSAT